MSIKSGTLQEELYGSVASDTTVWRALTEITPGRLRKITTARAQVRRHVWRQIEARHGRIRPLGSPAEIWAK